MTDLQTGTPGADPQQPPSPSPSASRAQAISDAGRLLTRRFRTSEYALPLSILGALVLFIYWDVIFGNLGLLDRDMLYIHLPMRMHFVNRILQGQFPEWYPFDGLGSGYIANAVPGLLHPTVGLHLIFSHVKALSLSAVLSHFFGGRGEFLPLKILEMLQVGCPHRRNFLRLHRLFDEHGRQPALPRCGSRYPLGHLGPRNK